MKKHQKAAIIGGILLSIVSFLPVLAGISGYGFSCFSHPLNLNPIIYPMIGIGFSTLLIIFSFYKE